MDRMHPFVLQLTGASASERDQNWLLDDAFFEALDQERILGGEVGVSLHITGSEENRAYELHFVIVGEVTVVCDRCLDPMTQPIQADEVLKVRLADTYADDGECITVPEIPGSIDVAWNIYEMVALAVPTAHAHPEGQCNPEMTARLAALQPTEAAADERWEALRGLNTAPDSDEPHD